MKTSIVAAALFSVVLNIHAQNVSPAPVAGQANRPAPTQDTPYTIVQSDANSRVWERTAYEKSPSGEMIPHVHSYTELGTGMHYQKGNKWVESKEEIEIDPTGGAKAIHGQHQAHFPYNIYDGVIEIVTPDGKHLQSRPLGISYFDGTNSVMIAELTNSVGQILPSGNQVIYTNAFTDFAADLLVTYRKGGLECDLILRERPPGPTEYGLSTNSRLELFTEFFNTPDPIHGAATFNPHNGLPDTTTLDFGSMKMIRGKAFTTGNDNEASRDIPVSKTWTHLQGRTVLIEELPVQEVEPQLQQLPAPSGQNASASGRHASASRQLPPQRLANLNTNVVRMAKADLSKNLGFVLDYDMVLDQSDYTFQADKTYYVSGPVNLSGTTTIEGNTVIKCVTNLSPSINILGTVNCLTAPYRPAVITSSQDSTIGETIPPPANSYELAPYFLYVTNTTYSGVTIRMSEQYYNPSCSCWDSYYFNKNGADGDYWNAGEPAYYGMDFNYSGTFIFDVFDIYFGFERYLYVTPQLRDGHINIMPYNGDITFEYYETGDSLGTPALATGLSLANGCALHDLRFCYLTTALLVSSGNYSITNAQFVNCGTAFNNLNASLFAGNILMNNVGTAVAGQSYQATVKQLTYDQGVHVTTNSSGSSSVMLINSLLTGVTDYGTLSVSTNRVVKLASSSGVYQTVGGGNHYLTNNSVYRGVGTNLDAAMAAQLAQKTTYPPIAYTNVTFTNAQVFNPQAVRDTNATPDLGYHYDALDYSFGSCVANSNITFSAGTAAGWFRRSSGGYHFGYGIHPADNTVVAFNGTVTAPDYWVRLNTVQEQDLTAGFGTAGIAGWATSSGSAPILRGTFLRASTMANEPGNHFAYNDGFLNLQLNHSEVWSGSVGGTGSYSELLSLTNCLFDRCVMTVYGSTAGVAMRNNLMHGGKLTINHTASSAWAVDVKDSAFDGTTISVNSGSNTNLIHYDYNAFKTNSNRLTPNGMHDVIVTDFNWQSSWLGNFYLPAGSSLVNAGDQYADQLGLYHFTTQTNQVKEINSVVDIGYHYAALDSFGNPDDTDGDGTPDYLEDSNGNGLVDSGESLWPLAISTQPQSQNVVQGQNVTFSVVAGGVTPFSYRWRSNGVNLPGETSSSLTKLVVITNDEANYSVVVTNFGGAVTSSVAGLSVNIPLKITGQTGGQTVLQGTNVSFSVAISGNYPVYQWYTNGTKINNGSRISGATSSTLTISNVAVSDELNYVVVVTNLFNSVTSSPASLTVIAKPGISLSPTNTTAIQSDDVTLRGWGTGERLYYQWWLTNGFGTNAISGATLSNYTKLVVQTNDAGHYCLTITNLAGSTNGNADLTVLVPPWITQQPASAITNQGSNVTFSISAVGTTNLSYRWYKNGTNAMANATNTSLTLNNVQAADAAGYSCLVTNVAGTNMSAWAWLSVNLSGGGTTNGWGSGGTLSSSITNSMIGPTNSSPTNPAIYLYGSPISIRASALSQYGYITNVAFYFTGTNYGTNFMLAGNAVPGANTKFALAWTNALPGTNILKARAWDNKGNTNDSGLVYVIMDRPPVVTTVPASISIVWEGYSTNVWFTNYVSDDGLPYGITNLTWTIPSGVTTSNANTYTSSNLMIATRATFTNSGTYALTLNVSDNFVSTNGTCNVVVKHRPVVSFNWPTNNATIVAGSPIVLNATATDPDGTITNVTFYNGVTVIGQAIPSVSSTYTYAWYSAPLWTNLISAVAWDDGGLTSTSTVSVVVVPKLAVQFVSPTNNQFFALSPTNIFLTALPTSYVGSTITSVLFSNVTQSAYIGTGTLTNSNYQTLWAGLTNGTYTINVTARDNAGNVASNGVLITVNTMPFVSIITPTNSQSFREVTNVQLTAVASDAEDGTNVSVVFYTNAPIGTAAHTVGASNTLVWTGLTANSRATNSYRIVAVATDSHGASSASQIVVFNVTPTNPPTLVTITYPADGAVFPLGSEITITATATNYPTSVTNVEFFVNGQSVGSDPTAPYTATKYGWTSGKYTLVAKATDNRGITAVSRSILITIGQKKPAGQGFWDPTFQMPDPADWVYGGIDKITALKVHGNQMYVGGQFGYIRWNESGLEEVQSGMLNWDGADWIGMGALGSIPHNVLIVGTNVYTSTDGYDSCECAQGVAVWDGGNNYPDYMTNSGPTNWKSVGDAYTTFLEVALTEVGSDLYASWNIEPHSDSSVTNYVAKWNPSTSHWERISDYLNKGVYAMANIGGHLYIGGEFTGASGNTNANYIAELVGNTWTNVGTGLGGPYGDEINAVHVFASSGTNLYVGGGFAVAGGNTNANGIAMWTGSEWRVIASGIDGGTNEDGSLIPAIVWAITPRGNTVFVGGQFTRAKMNSDSTIPASNIASATWNEDKQDWTWSDLDFGVSAGSSIVKATAVIEGSTPNEYDLIVGGDFNLMGSDPIQAIKIARWRVGRSYPTNLPTISILSPTNNTVFTNPPSIRLVATGAVTDISQAMQSVKFWANGTFIDSPVFVSGDSHAATYSLDWATNSMPPLLPGAYILTATAVAASNSTYVKQASKPIIFRVVDTNRSQSIVANNDTFTVFANSSAVALPVLTNDLPATGLAIAQVGQSPTAYGGYGTGNSSISRDGKYLVFTPTPFTFGSNYLWYAVTNLTGGLAEASATVFIRVPPVVQILSPNCSSCSYTSPVSSLTISGAAYDWDGVVTNLTFFTNGVPCSSITPTGTNFTFNWSASAPGFYKLQVVARDNNGYTNGVSGESVSGSAIEIDVRASSPSNAPVAIINTPLGTTNILGDSSMTWVYDGHLPLTGSAYDPDGDRVSYQIVLLDPNHPDSPPLYNITPGTLNAQGFHEGAVTNASLGTADLSSVENGSYWLELVVRGGGAEVATSLPIGVDSQLKIGQFSFSEQDLVLPVNGIPLTVTRTYNSLNPRAGQFGYSWTFALNDMNVQLDDERSDVTIGSRYALYADDEESDNGLPKVVNVRTGGSWDVTLTLPDGRRVTFPFKPRYTDALSSKAYAEWTSPPGVNATLTADPNSDEIYFIPSPHWEDSGWNFGSAPIEYHDIKGWILQTQDGTKYHVTRGKGNHIAFDPDGSGNLVDAFAYGPPKLTEIDDLATNKIVINDGGIFNYDPANALTRWTLFERDDAGRIVALRDPNGGSNGLPAVKYVYNNDTGNLIQVLKLVNRSAGIYTTNKYHYDSVKFPHYITSIENGDGVPVARNSYDDSGRLIAVQDANGTLTQFNHSLTNNSEVVIDRLGHTNSYVYDLKGNVIWATNALGQVTATAYNDPNNSSLETAVTNAYGTAQATWTLYAYDQYGNQTSVISMGHTNSFQYDTSTGNLLTQVDPLGNVTRNFYDSSGNLTNTAQYDANNNLLTQSSSVYANGKLIQTLNANGQPTATFGYDQFGNLTNSTDANGFARAFAYDANGNQTNSTYRWTPPGGGSAQTVTNTTEYDAQNRVIRTVDAFGNPNRTFYNVLGKVDYTIDKFGNTNSFLYDALGNLIQTTYPNNAFTRTVYDAGGRAYLTTDRNGITGTRTDFDATGRATNTVRLTNVVVNIVYSGTVAQNIVSSEGVAISTNSTVYDAAGRVTSRRSPDGTTSYDYYPDGQLMHVVDALNHTNFYAYDVAGRQTNVVDALNHSTKFYYDALGRMTNTLYADNTGITNIFDNLGQRTGMKDQAGLLTQFGYNVSGQLTNVVKPSVPDPENPGTSTNPKWSYLYDSYGQPTVTIDPKGRGTTNFFDAYGRQFSQRLTMNQTNKVVYNALGQMATNYDFLNQRTEFRYDRYGRVTNKFCFMTGLTHPSNSVSYAYNQLDQLTNITERYGSDADSIYAANNVEPQGFRFATLLAFMSRTAPRWGGVVLALLVAGCALTLVPGGRRLRSILLWYYLRGGAVAAVCDRRTKRLRLPSLFWRAVTFVTAIVLVVDDPTWDKAFTARADCSIPSNASTLTTRITNFVYDLDGRLAQMNAPEGVINYRYDLATGRLTSTCTTNSYIGYTADALGRLKTVTVSKRYGTNITSEVTTNFYDGVGNRSEVDLPNGVKTTYLYDSLNRLTNLTHKIGSATNAVYRYVLDATGRRTNAVEVLLQEGAAGYLTNTFTWQFDGMYRLTNEVNLCSAAGASYTNSYSYDLAGNRLKQITRAGNLVTITNSYDANDELLREVTQTGVNYTETNNYAYDLNGSMIGKTNITASVNTMTYAYDLMNKLGSVASNGTVQASYQYNAQGIRVRGTSGGTTNYYLIDANNHSGYQQVLEEFTALRGSPTRSYVLGDDVLAQAVGGTVSYLLYDGHGSTRQLSGSLGSVTSRYNYDAYGATQSTSTTTPETSMLYCGEQYDSTLKMYNLRARYYNPNNGRFNQRDTFAGKNFDPQSLHKYTYCHGDPINGVDPSGQFEMVELLVVIGVIAVLGAMLLPGLTKQKQSATATILQSEGKSDFQYEVERGRINANAPVDFLGVDQEEQQWMFDMANRDGNWERQIERATAGNQILTANAVQTVVTANDFFAAGLGVVGLIGEGETAADIVYRVIRNDENPALGLFAKNPSATYTPEGHIVNGSRPGWASQYISTTRDPAVAQFWADRDGCRIVAIDLNKVNGSVYDFSSRMTRNTWLQGNTARNFAGSSREVLIEGSVPANAILPYP